MRIYGYRYDMHIGSTSLLIRVGVLESHYTYIRNTWTNQVYVLVKLLAVHGFLILSYKVKVLYFITQPDLDLPPAVYMRITRIVISVRTPSQCSHPYKNGYNTRAHVFEISYSAAGAAALR